MTHWLQSLEGAERWRNSRVGQLCRRVEACRELGERRPEDPEYRDLRLALREINELWFVALILGDRAEDPTFKEAFERLLKDPLHPHERVGNTPGRDAQWELYVASIAVRAGLGVSRPLSSGRKQPDFIFSNGHRRAAVECKRVRTIGGLLGAAEGACSQIRACGFPGWLIADLTLATDEGAYVKVLDKYVEDEVLCKGQDACAQRFLRDHLRPLVETCLGVDVAYFQWHDCVLRPAAVHKDGRRQEWSSIAFWSSVPVKKEGHASRISVDEIKFVFDGALPQL